MKSAFKVNNGVKNTHLNIKNKEENIDLGENINQIKSINLKNDLTGNNLDYINNLLFNSEYEKLSDLMEIGTVDKINIWGKNMNFDITYDSFFNVFVSDNLVGGVVINKEMGEGLENIINIVLSNEDKYLDNIESYKEGLKNISEKEKEILNKLINDSKKSFNNEVLDDLVIKGDYQSIENILKRSESLTFNWNYGNGIRIDILFDKEKNIFVVKPFAYASNINGSYYYSDISNVEFKGIIEDFYNKYKL